MLLKDSLIFSAIAVLLWVLPFGQSSLSISDAKLVKVTGAAPDLEPVELCGVCVPWYNFYKCRSPYTPTNNSCDWTGCNGPGSGQFVVVGEEYNCPSTGTRWSNAWFSQPFMIDFFPFTHYIPTDDTTDGVCSVSIECDQSLFDESLSCRRGTQSAEPDEFGVVVSFGEAGECFTPDVIAPQGCRTCSAGDIRVDDDGFPIVDNYIERFCEACPDKPDDDGDGGDPGVGEPGTIPGTVNPIGN